MHWVFFAMICNYAIFIVQKVNNKFFVREVLYRLFVSTFLYIMYNLWVLTLMPNVAGKTKNWQLNLEDALREALDYQSSLNDMVQRLSEIDGQLSASKPVGGLPETAKEQLEEFMVSVFAISNLFITNDLTWQVKQIS